LVFSLFEGCLEYLQSARHLGRVIPEANAQGSANAPPRAGAAQR
jgi:hypothetical protein